LNVIIAVKRITTVMPLKIFLFWRAVVNSGEACAHATGLPARLHRHNKNTLNTIIYANAV
jgi:hypothetical protein